MHATDSTEANTLPAISVEGERDINAEAKKEIRNVPGGVSIRTAEEYREKSVIGLGDALAFVPGVYVQRLSGQEATRISIRGSGISSTYVSGIRFLRDGLPIGRVDDMNQGMLADVVNNDRVEIYRGASSLQYGASSLGGAVNLISSTGYTSPGVTVRTEVGSNGYLSGQIKAGKVFENGIDTFVSATHYQADGFREQSTERTSRLYANLGYAFSATSRGRFHLTEERYDGKFPGTLRLAQIRDNPQMAQSLFKRLDAYLRISPRWHMAYQHELDLDQGDKLSFGVFHTGTKFDSLTPFGRIFYDETDYGVSMRHEMNRTLGGHKNRFVWGMSYGRGSGDNALHTPAVVLPPPFSI
ncbi:TonB-dependent receptor plug domain-containing protein [uncultured Oxalicibacterium sp.]|uniref:TonB-dependent receptor plug domain-containing protein n=1 Tax=uncultured Oxalicibacterium sp. TaxID=1168540 RepID=UPI0025D27AC7|nr:TonB-dependent receptor plug domain-containing protein [uncultured Oxalicibacterium sp.]